MRYLTAAFTVAAAIAMGAFFVPPAQAGAWLGFGGLPQPVVTAPVQPAACGGRWGPHCPPGRHWVCGPYGYRCWCAPC